MLSAFASCAVGIHSEIRFFNVNLYIVRDLGDHVYRSERRVAPFIRIERRYPHQAMNAGFRLQETVGVFAFDQHGGVLDTRLLTLHLIEYGDLKLLSFGPLRIHPKEHHRPVARLGPAGAGIDAQYGVNPVRFAPQEALELQLIYGTFDTGEILLEMLERLMVLRRSDRDDLSESEEFVLYLREWLYGGLVAFEFPDRVSRSSFILPEVLTRQFRFEPSYAGCP